MGIGFPFFFFYLGLKELMILFPMEHSSEGNLSLILDELHLHFLNSLSFMIKLSCWSKWFEA